jgi:hypothetical protein
MSLDPKPPFPASRAFVLKLHDTSHPAEGVWRGRVEHMASGRQHDFRSGDELLLWLARMTPESRTCASLDEGKFSIPFPTTDGAHDE